MAMCERILADLMTAPAPIGAAVAGSGRRDDVLVEVNDVLWIVRPLYRTAHAYLAFVSQVRRCGAAALIRN